MVTAPTTKVVGFLENRLQALEKRVQALETGKDPTLLWDKNEPDRKTVPADYDHCPHCHSSFSFAKCREDFTAPTAIWTFGLRIGWPDCVSVDGFRWPTLRK